MVEIIRIRNCGIRADHAAHTWGNSVFNERVCRGCGPNRDKRPYSQVVKRRERIQ